MIDESLVRFSVSIDWELLKEFDKTIEKEGFENRSLVIRSLIKEYMLSSPEIKSFSDGVYVFIILTRGTFTCNQIHFCIPIKQNNYLHICLIKDSLKAQELVKSLKNNKSIIYFKIIPVEIENERQRD